VLGAGRLRSLVLSSSFLRLPVAVRRLSIMASSNKPLHRDLLLLPPPPPSPATYAALKGAYSAPLLTALQELSRSAQRAQRRCILEIALPCPHLYGQLHVPRGLLYQTTQSLVADVYKLVCVLAAKNS